MEAYDRGHVWITASLNMALIPSCKIVSSKWDTPPHWQILRWNVSKSWLQKVDFFENYAIVAMQSDNANFNACKIIKVTSGNGYF